MATDARPLLNALLLRHPRSRKHKAPPCFVGMISAYFMRTDQQTMTTNIPRPGFQAPWRSWLEFAKWIGRLAALFTLAFFTAALLFRSTGDERVGRLAGVVAWCMVLAIGSGLLTVAGAGFAFAFRRR